MESLKGFVRYSWNASAKVRSTVVGDLIETLKTNQTEGKRARLRRLTLDECFVLNQNYPIRL